MNENRKNKLTQAKTPIIITSDRPKQLVEDKRASTFTIGRAFRTVDDLRNWILHPEQDRTNNGFLTIQTPKQEHVIYEQYPSDRMEIDERVGGETQ